MLYICMSLMNGNTPVYSMFFSSFVSISNCCLHDDIIGIGRRGKENQQLFLCSRKGHLTYGIKYAAHIIQNMRLLENLSTNMHNEEEEEEEKEEDVNYTVSWIGISVVEIKRRCRFRIRCFHMRMLTWL